MAKVLKNYINGKFVKSSTKELLPVHNPATGEVIAKVPFSTKEDVERAVLASKKAFERWKNVPAVKRCQPLFKLKSLLEKNKEKIAKSITIEHGKEYPSALGEVERTIQMVECACGIPSLMKGDYSQDVSRGINEYSIRVPIGTFACIAPFNFPAMVPWWFAPWAVACGNSYIIKPSELCPCTQTLIFEFIDKCGFPPGVINLVHGAAKVGEYLIEHPDVKGISFVGSTRVARYVYKRCGELGKRVQAQGGANNFIVVMPDANLDKAMKGIMGSFFGNTGQRCLAGSILVGVGDIYEEMKKRFVEAARKLKVGNGLDKNVDMGPVVSKEALEKLKKDIEIGVKEGAKLILDGRNVKVRGYPKGYFLGPTIFEGARPGMHIFDEEIFGPVACVIKAETLDDAIRMINNSRYGNAATIITESGDAAAKFVKEVECGNVGINVEIAAPMAFYPFSGMKDSFFGVLHGQGMDAVRFFTEEKVVIERWYGRKGVKKGA